MTIAGSGAISLNDFHVEVGGSSGSQVSMNDQDIRDMILVDSNASNSFNSYYGGKKAFVMSMVVGFGNIFQDDGYNPASTIRTRGYNDGEFSNRTPSTYGTIGGTNSQTNSNCRPGNTDYISNLRVCAIMASVLSTTATSTHTSSSIIFRVSNSISPGTSTSNNDSAFKRISFDSEVLARSAASFSQSSGQTSDEGQWIWNYSFSPAEGFNDNSKAIPPLAAVGSTSRIVVAAT